MREMKREAQSLDGVRHGLVPPFPARHVPRDVTFRQRRDEHRCCFDAYQLEGGP